MENEKHFFPKTEQVENKPKIHTIKFDETHFGEQEISSDILEDVRRYGDSWIPGAINEWWKQICLENNIDPNDERLQKAHEYLLELGRNAWEYVGNGEIKVIFEPKRIIVTVIDFGQGFENPNEVIIEEHGLYLTKKYADEFIIESNGKKFTKVSKKKKLVETEDADIKQGSKITFIKNFE